MSSVESIPTERGWQYEPKWDGFRCLAHRDGAEVALISKAGQPLTRYFPEIVDGLRRLACDRYVLDGELVVPSAGALSFDALQQRIHPAASRVLTLSQRTPALYLVFDLLQEHETDLIDLPLVKRRARLVGLAEQFGADSGLRLSPATTDLRVVQRWFSEVGGALDGVVAKRIDASYTSGRTDTAVKVKQIRTADCVIGGFRLAAKSREKVGSLLLGLYDPQGRLDYIGFCSAFSNEERVQLLSRLEPFIDGSGFTGIAPGATPSRWNRGADRDYSYVSLEPQLVLEVGFDQVTSGRIRHGTKPLRWRTDKAPRRCTVDQLVVNTPVLGLLDLD